MINLLDIIDRMERRAAENAADLDLLRTFAPEAPTPEAPPEAPVPPPVPEPEPTPEPETPPTPSPEPTRRPSLPGGETWTRVSTLGRAERVTEHAEVYVLRMPTDPKAGSPAVFASGVLHGIVGPGASGGTGGVYDFDGGEYFTMGDRVNPETLTPEERAELDAEDLDWPLLVFRDGSPEAVGTLAPDTGEIRITDPTAEDGATVQGIAWRSVWTGPDLTDRLASVPHLLYDVPAIGTPPIGASLHCEGEGLIIHPRGAWGATVETPGATSYGEPLPLAPIWGDITGEGALESMDWSRTDPGTQPNHGAHIHACRGLRAGVIRFRGTIGDPLYTDGDPEYGGTESRAVEVTASGATFDGPIDEGARRHDNTGKPRAVLFTPDGEYMLGPVYETWRNRMPILRESDRPAMARFKEDEAAFESAVIGWATVWGQIEWARGFTPPKAWRVPGAVTIRARGATCLAPVDVEIERVVAGPSGRASAVFTGHDGLRITNASGPSIGFRDGLLHGIVSGGYTNAAVQGSSRRGTVAVRRDGRYGDWLIAGCRVPWKDHVEPGKDIEPGEPGESPSEFQNVGRNAWGHIRVRAFTGKAGAISGGEVGPVSIAHFDTDRSGASGLSIDDASEATVTVSGRGEGETDKLRGEVTPWADVVVAKDARGARVELAPGAFALVDSRAGAEVTGGRVLEVEKG